MDASDAGVQPEEPPRTRFTVTNTQFEVPPKYSLIRSVGNGSYGVVVSCTPRSDE